ARLARAISESLGGEVDICNEYGPTEATVGCMLHRFDSARRAGPTVAIGTPAANVQIYILDPDMDPIADNMTGEIYIAGDGLAQGYWRDAGQTAERFTANPFGDGERIYRTGDLARWSGDREIEYLGRIDDQVKFHGYRVELNEIRNAMNSHP